MNKGLVGLMVSLCVLLGGVLIFLQTKEDNIPPTIHFQDNEVIYTDGDDYDELLLGVTALDDMDGDVTDTLVVESVYPDDNKEKATVIYVARDRSNNIVKAKQKIIYRESDSDELLNHSDDEGDNKDEPVSLVESEGSVETQNIDNADEENEGNFTNADMDEIVIQNENPQIKLTTDNVTIKVGEYVDKIAFVDSVMDDKDESGLLWSNISIKEDSFDNNVPGVYELIYYVVDSDGNKSNEEKLTITVE